MERTLYGPEHEALAASLGDYLDKHVVPNMAQWEDDGVVPRSLYRELAELGVVGVQVPTEYGGAGEQSFLVNCVMTETVAYRQATTGSLRVHTDVVLPYVLSLATDEQKKRWLPGMASGELMSAIAMTEPGTGSDLAGMRTTARPDGDDWILNGAKTFISGGSQADLIIVVARTSEAGANRRAGLSLLVVEGDMPGFERGRRLKKLGLLTQDTAELFFSDVRVPRANMLGEEGRAFSYLTGNLPQERLSIAVNAQAQATAALRTTVDYVKGREVFGQALSGFQNTKFVLAELQAQLTAGQVLVDRAITDHERGALSSADAAAVKLFCTELQGRVVDECLQLHGGYGFVRDYAICRMYADARVTRIYGGTSEVMKSIIAKSMGL